MNRRKHASVSPHRHVLKPKKSRLLGKADCRSKLLGWMSPRMSRFVFSLFRFLESLFRFLESFFRFFASLFRVADFVFSVSLPWSYTNVIK